MFKTTLIFQLNVGLTQLFLSVPNAVTNCRLDVFWITIKI